MMSCNIGLLVRKEREGFYSFSSCMHIDIGRQVYDVLIGTGVVIMVLSFDHLWMNMDGVGHLLR